VKLDTVLDAAGLRTAIVLALALDPSSPHAFDRVLVVLGQAPGLLVLDNLETPWEGDMLPTQDTLHRLAAIPGLSLMASLRGTAAPSSPAFTHAPTLPPLSDTAARDLFLEIAAGKHATDPLLPRFLAELDGHPLSIELVALRAVTQDDLTELWDQWQKRGPALARHPDLPEGRLTSVIRSIDLSWQSTRLRDPGRLLFRLLGASPAGLAREDREALLGDDAWEAAEQVLRVGLAFARDGRLDLRPPVRGFARAMTPLAPEDEDRWCRYFLALTEEQGERVGADGGAEAAARLTPELPNLEAAFAAALAEPRRAAATSAAWGYGKMLCLTGLGRPAPLTALAAVCRDAGEENAAAACLYQLGDIALCRSDHDSARARHEEALPLYRRVGSLLGEANCIQSLGDIALRRSDHDNAQARYEEALSLYRRVGSVVGEANCIKALGDIALARSDHDSAQARYEEALPLYRRVGDVLGEAHCIWRLGDIALRRSDHDSAQARYEEALPLYRRVGDVLGEANCIQGLGDIALRRSDHDSAQARYEEALPLYRRVGDVIGEGNCLAGLGRVAAAMKDRAGAAARYREALALHERMGATRNVAIDHEDLADVTEGAERDAHVQAARAAWLSMGLPDQAARVTRRFG